MPFTIHREAPKVKLITLGQGDKEMPKNEVSYETHPELYHLRPGTTEPELIEGALDSTAATDVVSKEPVGKEGPVGAKGEPRKAETTNKKK